MKKKIIAIGAHIDDIELGCGGTLAKAVSNGHEVRMVVLSKSGYQSYDKSYGRSEEEASAEGSAAVRILGVQSFEIYDFPTKDIPNDSSVVEILNSEFDAFKPDLIFTHWQFDTHKSHMNTALSTFAAARYYNSILMYEPFPPAGRSYVAFRPQFYIDISTTIEKKINAISEHKSELKKYGVEWINSIRSRAAMRGFELISTDFKQEKFAEVFEVLRLNLEII